MTKIVNVNKSIDKSSIEAFELNIGLTFPGSYISFLLDNNGGTPEPNCFTSKDGQEGSCVDQFLGLNVDEYCNLEIYYEDYKDRIPKGFLPIAFDPGGNLVIMKINNGGEDGGIYFWDHENEAEGFEPDMSNTSLISESLGDFLDSLHEIPED